MSQKGAKQETRAPGNALNPLKQWGSTPNLFELRNPTTSQARHVNFDRRRHIRPRSLMADQEHEDCTRGRHGRERDEEEESDREGRNTDDEGRDSVHEVRNVKLITKKPLFHQKKLIWRWQRRQGKSQLTFES